MAGLDSGAAKREHNKHLADAWRPEQQDVFRLRDEVAGGELADELGVERRLELEVELLEGLHHGEVRDLDSHCDATLLLGVELLAKESVEEVEIRGLFARGVGERSLEPVRCRAQPQALHRVGHPSTDNLADQAPPATAA